MKLLLDENLSDRIVFQVDDLFPGTTHVKVEGLMRADDIQIWEYAVSEDYVILSKGWDFHQLSLVHGFPPKVIYLGMGNCSTQTVVTTLRERFSEINSFHDDPEESLLVLG